MMNITDAQNTAFIQQMNRVYPPKRKVLVIEWPDQRTVFQKHKGNDFNKLKLKGSAHLQSAEN